jgi:hypothetical protein
MASHLIIHFARDMKEIEEFIVDRLQLIYQMWSRFHTLTHGSEQVLKLQDMSDRFNSCDLTRRLSETKLGP